MAQAVWSAIRIACLRATSYSACRHIYHSLHSHYRAGRQSLTNTHALPRLLRRPGLVAFGLCALPVKAATDASSVKGLPEVNPSTLTTSALIKNATSLAVDSTSGLMTQTFVAVIDKYKELAQAIEVLMDLTQGYRQAEKQGYLTDELWQSIVEARVIVDDKRHEIQDLEAILNSALLALEASCEAAFQAGQEELAMLGRDRCQYANNQLALTRAVIQRAETALVKIQADAIREMKKMDKEVKDEIDEKKTKD